MPEGIDVDNNRLPHEVQKMRERAVRGTAGILEGLEAIQTTVSECSNCVSYGQGELFLVQLGQHGLLEGPEA